ncbi:MAG: ribonuclease J [Firmicutes bacterium]|nr:ribonuclease J [Bacillota bacterium]
MPGKSSKISIIPLGGIGEIGKNITAIRYQNEMIIIDAGLMFPEEDELGVDIVIPEISYLTENSVRSQIKAIFLTHGHDDHIGALPYIWPHLKVPVYGTRFTLGLVGKKLAEHELADKVPLHPVQPRQEVTVGNFRVEFFRVNHSIADAAGLAIHTPMGTIVHTGDYKFDHTPVDGQVADFQRLASLGEEGVLALLGDSTNAERPGYTHSEKAVGATIEEIFRRARSRIILATFSSNVHRIQQTIDAAVRNQRKMVVIGRSVENVVEVAEELGYLKIPKGTRIPVEELAGLPASKTLILTTGSQGEPMSSLTRMAMADHRRVEIEPGDTVIIAAAPIPGNEKLVARTIDHLIKQGAEVIYEAVSGVHVSGHASQEELKLMLNLVRPRFFVPVHGYQRHLKRHAELARELGIPSENIFILENGSILDMGRDWAETVGRVPAGRVLVDGLGVGDVGNIVLRDRRLLAQDGILVVVITINKQTGQLVAGPDIVSRGFIYVREAETLLEEARGLVREALTGKNHQGPSEWSSIKSQVRDVLAKALFERTRRRPMILPIIMEV